MDPVARDELPTYLDYDTRLAAYARIVDHTGRVLLALWNEGEIPMWTMPGGGVELHESVEQAAVRELFEETGYHVELTGLVGIDSRIVPPHQRVNRGDRPLKAVRVVFEARVIGGELRHEAAGTTSEARWVPLTEVAGLPRVSLVDAALSMSPTPIGLADSL